MNVSPSAAAISRHDWRDETEGRQTDSLQVEVRTYVQTRIGRAIRIRRRLMDLTLQQVADACGVSFQQVQKYEAANTSISAAQLWVIAGALSVPVGYFFEGVSSS